MGETEELLSKPQGKAILAYHLLTQTYPFVQDSRLLLSVLENTYLAMNYCLKAVLSHEFKEQKILLLPKSFDIGIRLFELRMLRKYHISRKYLKAIRELRELLLHHKDSPVEFARKDSFIICDEDYHLKIISLHNVKEYIHIAQDFIEACMKSKESHDRKLQRSA